MDVDAIVPVFSEDSDRVWRTIDGLLRQDASLNRTIVIDDGSPTPLSLSDHLRARDEVELMRMPHSLGPGGARNVGARSSHATFLLFVNCDVVLPISWVRAARAFMESHPNTAAIGGPIAPQIGSRTLVGWRLRFLENPEQRSTGPISVSWLTGHAILVNRAMFNEVGGYEPSLRFTEDFDLCRRLRAKGYEILHLPELAANSYEVPTIDLFARKTLRHSGWSLRTDHAEAADLREVQLLETTHSILRDLASRLARNVYRRRTAFLRVDIAVAIRSFVLVWSATRKPDRPAA